jgi:hypothetical protein
MGIDDIGIDIGRHQSILVSSSMMSMVVYIMSISQYDANAEYCHEDGEAITTGCHRQSSIYCERCQLVVVECEKYYVVGLVSVPVPKLRKIGVGYNESFVKATQGSL